MFCAIIADEVHPDASFTSKVSEIGSCSAEARSVSRDCGDAAPSYEFGKNFLYRLKLSRTSRDHYLCQSAQQRATVAASAFM